MLSIPEIDFGSIDAVSYRQRDKKALLQKILYKEHYLHEIIQPSKYFLIGEKGTGKTSYSVFLENNDYENTRSKVIELNSTDYQKFISLKENGALSVSSYSDVWRVILLMLLSDAVAELASESVFSFRKFSALRDAINDYYNDAFKPEVDYSLEFVKNSEAALGLIAEHGAANFSTQKTEKKEQTDFQISLFSLQKKFEEALSSLKLEKNIILFIDGIDIRPEEIPFSRYIECIKGLANAAWYLNSDYLANVKDSKGRLKVCILMRPDILDQMGLQNLNAKVRDNGVVLNWQTTYEQAKRSPIFDLVSGIIAQQQTPPVENDKAWGHYFPYSLQNQRISEKFDDPFIGFLRYSFYRPRDIVQYLTLMQDYVENQQEDKLHFTEKAFHRCEGEFSDYLLGEVKDYLSFYYGSVDFDQIVGFFSMFKGSNRFSWDEFKLQFSHYQMDTEYSDTTVDELKGTPEQFLQFLYSLNLIGYLEPEKFGGTFVHWCFRDRTPVKLRPKVKVELDYTVHPGLARSLLVGSTAGHRRPSRKREHRAQHTNLRGSAPVALQEGATGEITVLQLHRGFAFIRPDDGTDNVFVPLAEIKRSGIGKVHKGLRLSFDIVSRSDGKRRARKLERLD